MVALDTAMTVTIPDRAAILAEYDTMRRDFHALIDSLTDAEWRQRSASTQWTNGELLTHRVLTFGMFPKELACARQSKNFMNMPGFVMRPVNYTVFRLAALMSSRRSLKRRFDQYHAAALRQIDQVSDDEWREGAEYFGEGYRDIEALCRLHPHHFAEHAAQVSRSTGK